MVNTPHEASWGRGDAPLWFMMVSYSRGCFLLDLTAHPMQLFQLSTQWVAEGPPHLSLVERSVGTEASVPHSPSRGQPEVKEPYAVVPGGHGIFIWRRFHMPRLEWK